MYATLHFLGSNVQRNILDISVMTVKCAQSRIIKTLSANTMVKEH